MTHEMNFTPREIVSELDRYIIGQTKAKRAVAVALRNRWRRRRVEGYLREEITPKNIILIGPTGVGKTEIARRMAKLAGAPFLKVEASKFTEVGYVGRDVDSMVRDLMEIAVRLVKQEARERIMTQAEGLAEERLLDILLPRPKYEETAPRDGTARDHMKAMLRKGELDDRDVEIDIPAARNAPAMQFMAMPGGDDMGLNIQEMMGQMLGKGPSQHKRVKVPEARKHLAEAEADKLIDQDAIIAEAVKRAEQDGIIFLDEIDKIAQREGASRGGSDVSREGVQRDILPIVEGSAVNTKYGVVRTDHVLFIAAGAFHVSKVSDLIPELQGRFPVRVQLDSLDEHALLRILKEPHNALPVQYQALLATEGVKVVFTDDGLLELARIAASANERSENIGARRLHTVLECLLEDIGFIAPESSGSTFTIDAALVRERLASQLESEDLARYIL